MKKMNYILGVVLISGIAIVSSCTKKSSDSTPTDLTPTITFNTGTGFVSSDVTLPIKQSFKVGVIASSNASSGANLTKFTITRVINGQTSSQDTAINVNALNINVMATTNSTPGQEKWSFKVTDKNGQFKEISFTITTIVTIGEYGNSKRRSFASLNENVFLCPNPQAKGLITI